MLKPVTNCVTKSYFHTTGIAFRKSGSKSLEPAVRLPSKKQTKRKTKEIVKSAETVDKNKEKTKIKHIKDQYSSKGMQNYISDMKKK